MTKLTDSERRDLFQSDDPTHVIVERIITQRLSAVADALAAQPPKLKGQYVGAIRLYASEDWRYIRDGISSTGQGESGS